MDRLSAQKKALEMIDKKEKKKDESKKSKPSECLQEIKRVLRKYIDTGEGNISLLSHWIQGTYYHDQFETYPLANIYAQKRSGKTRTLKLSSALSKNSDGSLTASLTETHLFRRGYKPAFFDELESINNKEQGNLRELLNASYKRGSKISRYKEKKKEYVEEVFTPFYPIMIANINGLNDVLGDRSIEIILRRSEKEQTLLIEDFDTNKEIKLLKEKLSELDDDIPQNLFSQWNSYIQGLEIENKDLLPLFERIKASKIHGRPLEIFFPLIIVSYLADDLDEFLEIAQDYVRSKEEAELVDNYDERLKLFINSVEMVDFVEISRIVDLFKKSIESPETWINEKWVSKTLKKLDLIAQKRLYHGKTQIRIKFNNTSTNSTRSTNSTISTISTNNDNICYNCKKKEGFVVVDSKKYCEDCCDNVKSEVRT